MRPLYHEAARTLGAAHCIDSLGSRGGRQRREAQAAVTHMLLKALMLLLCTSTYFVVAVAVVLSVYRVEFTSTDMASSENG